MTRLPTRVLQGFLARAGFDPGPIDGVLGPRTVQALESFQASLPSETVVSLRSPSTPPEHVEACRSFFPRFDALLQRTQAAVAHAFSHFGCTGDGHDRAPVRAIAALTNEPDLPGITEQLLSLAPPDAAYAVAAADQMNPHVNAADLVTADYLIRVHDPARHGFRDEPRA